MATNANLPSGAFLTTIGGKKCTAVPLKKNDVTSTTTAQITSVSSVTTTTQASSQTTTTVDVTTSLVTSTTATVVAPPPPPETSTVLESTTTAVTTSAAATSTVTTTTAATTTVVTSATNTSTVATTTSIATTQTQVSPPEGQVPPGTTRTAATTSTSLDTLVSTATSETQTPPGAAIPAPSQGSTTSVGTTSQTNQPASTQDSGQAPNLSTKTSTAGVTNPADGGATTTAASTDVGSTTSTDPASQATTTFSTNSDGALVPLPITSPGSTGLFVSSAPDSTGTAGAANPVTTTNASGVVVTQTPTVDTRPQETALASTAGSTGMTPQATAAVAGGVAGSVVVLALLAFLFCWCRRRRRNNGSVPTTPTYSERSTREKEPYVIMRSSIGPTPATEKFKASLHYRYQQALMQVTELCVRAAETVGLRKRSDVDLDRGLSQYGPLMAGGHSRSNSGVLLAPADQPPKREYPDWWDRLTEDGENWHIKPEDSAAPSRTGSIPIGIQGLPSAAAMTAAAPTAAKNASKLDNTQPTTLGKLPAIRGGQPREGAPSDHFLSNLGLNIDNSDPFSDVNSMSHVSAMVMPLAAPTEQNQNPFSDANAISKSGASRGPSNYVQGVQHARQESYGTMLKRKQTESVYRDRESTFSQESFQTRRNRVKSDPFDLDRLVGPLNNPLPATTTGIANNERPPTMTSSAARQPEPPRRAHVRQPSATSSKYSSGVESEAGWSDPGPDVGPSIGRTGSKASMGSIGKAK